MEEEIDVSVTVEQLRAAGTDLSKQVPALLKLGKWYLKKAQTTLNGDDFTKANGLYNAALVRSRRVNHEIDEDQILRQIVETYREFLYAFVTDDEGNADEIRHEIDAHKEFLANERKIFKGRVDVIDSTFNTNDKTEDQYQIHADQLHDVFRDIQDMYIRLVSMLAKECENRMGKPPCDYAIIALGSVARIEATPFSDLEFAILYSDPAIGDKINYFRVMSHFLHLKVINLGETILPSLAIEQLNDFQSSDRNSNWFFDSETPRGISFDGAMPWASKTALGRLATTNKPALELIRTPDEMAEFQDEEIAVKEGYHLAEIMSRVELLYGDQALVDEYNKRVAEKLNTKTPVMEGTPTETVGFHRGMQQMMFDLSTYNPFHTYLGPHSTAGALLNAKKQLYRLMSLLLSDFGMVFDIRSSSPWQISSELQTRGIIGETESASIKVCLSIANKIRLKTYFANNGQRELFSPVPQDPNTNEKSADAPLFRDFGEDVVVHFLSISNDIFERCHRFCAKLVQQGEIDVSVFHNPSVVSSKAFLLGSLYARLQNFPKALEWLKSESKDSPQYSLCLHDQGIIHNWFVKTFNENALEAHYQNEANSNLNVLLCTRDIALTLLQMGRCEQARMMLEKTIKEHDEIHGKGFQSVIRCDLMQTLGRAYYEFGDVRSALETFQEVEQMQSGLANVPDMDAIQLNSYIAMSLDRLDQHAQAMEYMKRTLKLSEKVFGDCNLSITLVEIYVNAAVVYERCHLNDEALSFVTRSLNLLQLIFGDSPHPAKINCLNKLGYLFYGRHEASKAVESFENSLRQARSLYHGKPRITVASTLNYLGMALQRAGKSKESLPCFLEAKEIMDSMLGPDNLHPITSRILDNMVKVYKDLGDLGKAKAYCTKVVDIDRKNPKTDDECPCLVFSLFKLSEICEALGEQGEALKHLEKAREIAKVAGSKHAVVVQVLFKLVMKYFRMLSFVKCKMCLDEALEIAKTFPEDDAPPVVMDLLKLQKQFGYSSPG